MKIYQCKFCGYVYNEREGDPNGDIPPNTKWEELPEDWRCPICGAKREDFEKLE